jgi:hypothetical protein
LSFWVHSIGLALTDTLDDLISDDRINPQLAIRILMNFDQAMTEGLQKHVKARLSFKVRAAAMQPGGVGGIQCHATLRPRFGPC